MTGGFNPLDNLTVKQKYHVVMGFELSVLSLDPGEFKGAGDMTLSPRANELLWCLCRSLPETQKMRFRTFLG